MPENFKYSNLMERAGRTMYVSVVMPCYNEEQGLPVCIAKIKEVFKANYLKGEIIVVDNASTDNSAAVAASLGAKLIPEPNKGYGSAYLAGLKHCKGRSIILGDADNSYDFYEIPRFLEALKDHDMVIGHRKYVKKGAMPLLHRYVGNPFFSFLLRFLFKINISDSHCGFGAIKRSALKKLALTSTGMEFASEILIKARKADLAIMEIPITYHPRLGTSKLRPFQDGLRHLVLIMREYLA